MKKIFSLLLSRLVITGILILLQAIIFFVILWRLSSYFVYIYIAFILLSFLILLYIMNEDQSPSLKLPWILLIFVVPLFGGLLYVMFAHNRFYKKDRERLDAIYMKKRKQGFDQNIKDIAKTSRNYANEAFYIARNAYAPVHRNTKAKYFDVGEKMYVQMLEDLKKAEHFIFIEYFIIAEGKMWDAILDILIEKASFGLDVRVMYDGIGSICTLPNRYDKKLEKAGIKCAIFNPFKPILSIGHNNRDHRKIMVIDGYIGYTGGINIADEYINEIDRFGHWKDTAIRLYGEAVINLTDLFLISWNHFRKEKCSVEAYSPHKYHSEKFATDGYIQPFGDRPLDGELLGETIYMNLISSATTYIYIYTPYLIVSYEVIQALCNAAKRGVDVRITTPHIPDKWYIHVITQSHYKALIESGVKVYEYRLGFVHAKSFVVDDLVAVIGTINLDYRSFLHHFECGVWLYKNTVIQDMKEDYEKTLNKCIKIKMEMLKNVPWYKRWTRNILQFFAPLL